MEMCEDKHDPIVYETRKCPLCQAMAEADDALEEQKKEIEHLHSVISSLEEAKTNGNN